LDNLSDNFNKDIKISWTKIATFHQQSRGAVFQSYT